MSFISNIMKSMKLNQDDDYDLDDDYDFDDDADHVKAEQKNLAKKNVAIHEF